jgi:tRNA (adenine37-N6)-methyltransferase
MNRSIIYNPIGVIYTPFTNISGMPIQPLGGAEYKGRVEVKKEFVDGLKDLGGFSHVILLYHFHYISGYELNVVPFMDDKPRGIFSTRAPKKPNAIGISVVQLERINNNILEINGVDILNETPLLDIKPYYPKYDIRTDAKSGWLAGKENIDITKIKSDNRFDEN